MRLLLEVARFELRFHAREFLTWIYMAVFFLLTFGFTASGAVELVGGRGGIPKNAPWVVAQAMAGVTAFGQVITTMIAATAILRDVASRTQELLFTTRLDRRGYVGGRFVGAVIVMSVVYLGIPAGAIAGAMMPWIPPDTLLPFDLGTYARPWMMLIVPNVLVVSALFFAAGARGRGFMAILLLGVSLVALWQTGIALVQAPGAAWTGALLDPFGNAALIATTRDWSTAERGARIVPWSVYLITNRLLWLLVAGSVAAVVMSRFRLELAPPAARRSRPRDSRVMPAPRPWNAIAPVQAATAIRQVAAEAVFVLRGTITEKGFLALALLGALNAGANAWRVARSGGDPATIVEAMVFHSRLFLILIATIYAGELVWRDRDLRVDELRDTLPVRTGAIVAGRVGGIALAELLLVAVLLVTTFGAVVVSGSSVPFTLAAPWLLGVVYPSFVQLTLLSLLVHALVQNKVGGHVTLIAGWVAAVALDANGFDAWWYRFAEVPPIRWSQGAGFVAQVPPVAGRVLYWMLVAAGCGLLASRRWRRGARG